MKYWASKFNLLQHSWGLDIWFRLWWFDSDFLIPPTSSPHLPRSGTIWEHDAGVLQGGRGGVRGVRRDAGLHVRGRVQVEARPGQQGEAGQRQPHPLGAARQQVWPEEGQHQQHGANGQFLQRDWISGLVRNLCQGERSSTRDEEIINNTHETDPWDLKYSTLNMEKNRTEYCSIVFYSIL